MLIDNEQSEEFNFPTIYSQRQNLRNRYPVVLRPHVVHNSKDFQRNIQNNEKTNYFENDNEMTKNGENNLIENQNNQKNSRSNFNLKSRKSQKRHNQYKHMKNSKVVKKRSIAFDDDSMADGLSDDMNNLLESRFRISDQDSAQPLQNHPVNHNRRPFSLENPTKNQRTHYIRKNENEEENNIILQPSPQEKSINNMMNDDIDNTDGNPEDGDDDYDKKKVDQIW